MDIFKKFIIEDNNLIIAKCTYHIQLANDYMKVKGGGWFEFNKETNIFILGGSSDKFGKADIVDIRNCINLGNIWNNRNCTKAIDKKCKFIYYSKDGKQIILN